MSPDLSHDSLSYRGSPIIITCNEDFASQGWLGSGTRDDPYQIVNIYINLDPRALWGYTSSGIEISNTDRYFLISRCPINPDPRDQSHGCEPNAATIKLTNVANGRIEQCNLTRPGGSSSNLVNLVMINCRQMEIVDNDFMHWAVGLYGACAIKLESSHYNSFRGNVMTLKNIMSLNSSSYNDIVMYRPKTSIYLPEVMAQIDCHSRICLTNSSYNKIKGLTSSEILPDTNMGEYISPFQLELNSSFYNSISRNLFLTYVNLLNSSSNRIEKNENMFHGVNLNNSYGNVLTRNNCVPDTSNAYYPGYYSPPKFDFFGSNSNTISYNNFDRGGLSLKNSQGNKITRNYFQVPGLGIPPTYEPIVGINLDVNSGGNTIWLNRFDGRAEDYSSGNKWYNYCSIAPLPGIPSIQRFFRNLGNYWRGWQPPLHLDENDDGIIDSPYNFFEGRQDPYPLLWDAFPTSFVPEFSIVRKVIERRWMRRRNGEMFSSFSMKMYDKGIPISKKEIRIAEKAYEQFIEKCKRLEKRIIKTPTNLVLMWDFAEGIVGYNRSMMRENELVIENLLEAVSIDIGLPKEFIDTVLTIRRTFSRDELKDGAFDSKIVQELLAVSDDIMRREYLSLLIASQKKSRKR